MLPVKTLLEPMNWGFDTRLGGWSLNWYVGVFTIENKVKIMQKVI